MTYIELLRELIDCLHEHCSDEEIETFKKDVDLRIREFLRPRKVTIPNKKIFEDHEHFRYLRISDKDKNAHKKNKGNCLELNIDLSDEKLFVFNHPVQTMIKDGEEK